MPVDPVFWDEWRAEHDLFHMVVYDIPLAVSAKQAKKIVAPIIRRGLRPGAASSRFSMRISSRRGFVYLATRDYLDGAFEPGAAFGPMLRIDSSALDPALIYADEDSAALKYYLELANGATDPEVTLGEWAELRALGDDPQETKVSLMVGSMAYKGHIPGSALKLAAPLYVTGMKPEAHELYEAKVKELKRGLAIEQAPSLEIDPEVLVAILEAAGVM